MKNNLIIRVWIKPGIHSAFAIRVSSIGIEAFGINMDGYIRNWSIVPGPGHCPGYSVIRFWFYFKPYRVTKVFKIEIFLFWEEMLNRCKCRDISRYGIRDREYSLIVSRYFF